MQGVLLAERFRIRDRLGAGGMGQVWSAQDERMRRDVAVKVVHPQYGMDEAETQARFQREVQLAGRLSHQNIVTVHDWGEVPVDGRRTLFLVMELVHGVPLHKRFKESAPLWPLAVGWAVQIAQALHAAHREGVVHRDIKPANVLLTPEGTVKVLDFGVAKFMGDTIGARELTVTGAPLGSPPYMSPEQAEGAREIDHRSDLYSLGCLLYHAVTGRPPFTSTTQWAVLRMQMEDTPTPPGALAVGLPGPLNELILRLLAKRPQDRPANAAAVYDALSTVLVDQAITVPGGNILDATQLGHAESLSGRLLTKASQLWQLTERHTTARRTEAEEVLGLARQEAAQERERAREQREELLASARNQVEQAQTEAVRLIEEADRHATAMVSNAEQTAQQERDNSKEYRAKTVELQVEARRLRGEAEQLRADAVAESERIRSEARLEAVQQIEEAAKTAEELLTMARADAESRADQTLLDAQRRAEDIIADANARTARIRSEPGGEPTAGTSPVRQDRPLLPPFGFDVVVRGYNQAQVDSRVSKLVADRDSALARIAHLEVRIEEEIAERLDSQTVAPVRGQAGNVIDEAYARAEREFAAHAPQARKDAVDSSHGFELVLRGYDRAQVNDRMADLMADRDSALIRITALERLIEELAPAQQSHDRGEAQGYQGYGEEQL
ncbi:serine/threonine protein kinase [Streptomyces sp. NBC_01236]|uniref:serine/threonine protein kinase n=1 Tax=Streptomyces sp. NBC_01236 TaxID=2903789 RepID=UPI002E161142|nr:protein kinase [Streptomyces sp. NBC_01236]